MLGNSNLNFGLIKDGKLIGFSRVLSDFTYKALLFDFIVDKNERGHGLGRFLMEAVLTHPKVRQTQHLDLNCLPDVESFYQQFDFKTLARDVDFLLMRRINPK